MSNTGTTPSTPRTNVQEPHEHTDGGMPPKDGATDLKAAAAPKSSTPGAPKQ